LLALAGCGWDPFASPTPRPSQTFTPPATATAEPQPSANAPVEPGGRQTLTLWLPPQFDPQNGSAAANRLQERLAAFETANPDLQVQVRVKAPAGPGGLMEALTAANAAAPDAVPSLIALTRSDLEAAALKGLILPLAGSRALSDGDWYPYAEQLAAVQGNPFGLPFAGDALVLLYRPERIPNPPQTWTDVLSHGEPLAFAAADPQASVTLDLYQSAGGELEDGQGRPALDAGALVQVLELYESGARGGTFPAWLTQYQTDAQAWQAFREARTSAVINWASRYLDELPADTALTALPGLGESPKGMATAWAWALAERDPALQPAATRLAEFLVSGDFLGPWSESAGALPTRPSALAAWQNATLRAQISAVVQSAGSRPRNDLTASLGPVLSEATNRILAGEGESAQVAQQAVEQVGAP
jgi:ABC-type glycerol-3-phosphate transport system substrate-binding protein